MSDFNITLFEACELLNRSKKSISRYIRRGLLHPERVKSQQGTLEYRFTKADIEAFKALEAQNADETRQDETGQPEQTGQSGQTRQDTLKAENIKNKDVLEETRQDTPEQTRQDRTRETGQDSEVITLLKETTGLLKKQLVKKDEQIKDLGGKIITFGSDSHNETHFGHQIETVKQELKLLGFESFCTFDKMEPTFHPL